MLLSFFSPTEYVTGIDYSHHPECLHTEDIDFDPSNHTATIEEKDWKYLVKISEKPIVQKLETPTEKHARILQKIISTEGIKKEDLEGEIFSSDEKRKIINQLVYGDELSETLWIKKEMRLASKSNTLYTKPSAIFTEKEKVDCLKIQAQNTKIEELKTLLS